MEMKEILTYRKCMQNKMRNKKTAYLRHFEIIYRKYAVFKLMPMMGLEPIHPCG